MELEPTATYLFLNLLISQLFRQAGQIVWVNVCRFESSCSHLCISVWFDSIVFLKTIKHSHNLSNISPCFCLFKTWNYVPIDAYLSWIKYSRSEKLLTLISFRKKFHLRCVTRENCSPFLVLLMNLYWSALIPNFLALKMSGYAPVEHVLPVLPWSVPFLCKPFCSFFCSQLWRHYNTRWAYLHSP